VWFRVHASDWGHGQFKGELETHYDTTI